MAASKPTYWTSWRSPTPSITPQRCCGPQHGTLTDDLGFFPLDPRPSRLGSFYRLLFCSCLQLSWTSQTQIQRSLHQTKTKPALYLNRFHKKPAIFQFVWSFTPGRTSSLSFATDVRAVLQHGVSQLSTWMRPAHWISGLLIATSALCSLGPKPRLALAALGCSGPPACRARHQNTKGIIGSGSAPRLPPAGRLPQAACP